MTTAARLRGVIAAIPTPVTRSGEPDIERFMSLAQTLLDTGCDGLNVLGTTGEATSFGLDQRMELMTAAAVTLPLTRLMVGTGTSSIADTIRLTRHAAQLGFAGALILPPFYYKGVTDEGVIDYISRLAEATASNPVPLYLYHFPALSGVPFSADIVRELVSRFGVRIAGLKDSSGDMDYARSIAAIASDLAVFPSNEVSLLEARDGAFAGCISATASLNAPFCARAFHEGDERALGKAVAIRRLFDGLPLVPAVKHLIGVTRSDPEYSRVLPPLAYLDVTQVAELAARRGALS